MSLLMDALKKAEQAKAKTDEEQISSSAELPIETQQPEKDSAVETKSTNDSQQASESTESLSLEEIKPVPKPETEELDFSIENVETLEDVKAETAEPDVTAVDVQTDINNSDVERPEQNPVEAEAPENSHAPVKAPEPPQIEEKPPAAESLPKTEEKHEPQAPVPEPKSEIEEASPQVSDDRPVKAVPTLIGKRKSHRTYIWVALIVFLMFSGLGYYYFALMDSTQQQGLALVDNIDQQLQPPEEEVQISGPEIGSASEESGDESPPAEASKAIAVPKPVEKQLSVPSETVIEKPASPVKEAKVAGTPKQTEPKQLQFTRSEKIAAIDIFIAAAYLHYLGDELDDAEVDYRRALKVDRDNRDALLGLAVVYQRQGYLVDAEQLYRRVLALDPKDSVANAGLMSLPVDGNSLQNETRLKLMLNEEPTAAHLHFSLGNEYAARANWPEAQQAYFNAYRHAPENGDYAYNLAISLEQLGQPQAALPYYQRAQEIAVDSVVGFDPQKVAQRIDALSKTTNGQ